MKLGVEVEVKLERWHQASGMPGRDWRPPAERASTSVSCGRSRWPYDQPLPVAAAHAPRLRWPQSHRWPPSRGRGGTLSNRRLVGP